MEPSIKQAPDKIRNGNPLIGKFIAFTVPYPHNRSIRGRRLKSDFV